MEVIVPVTQVEVLRLQSQALKESTCQCDVSAREYSLAFNEREATIGYACYGCNQDKSVTFAIEGLSVPRCPFCDGGLVLAGYSRFEIGGSSIGSMCHRCGASVTQNRGVCGVRAWRETASPEQQASG